MKVVNVSFISGEVVIDTIGIVNGNFLVSKTFRERNFNKDLEEESDAYDEYFRESTEKMIKKAEKLGADAIVNANYQIVPISKDKINFMVYGTAVKFKK